MNYYKAVRPDGTDFATRTTRPVVGEWMPRIEGELVLCERGYHVSDAPAETLIGGSWPCRLFEVEIAENETPPTHIDWHKRVTHSYRPIRELPAWQALGPNGQDVAALIERCKTLTVQEINDLDAAWDAREAPDEAREAAREAAWEAREAAQYAAWALIVRDLITPEQFDMLYGPWADVIEGKQ